LSEDRPAELETPPRGIDRFLPSLAWLRDYGSSTMTRDTVAGILVAVLLVPQAMAYAMLADLPPRIGLYAALVPAVVYAFLGTSRFLSVGPVALVSLLVAQATSGGGDTEAERTAAALVLAAMVAMTLLLLGVFRLGFLANFLSTPVLKGFTGGAAVLIGASQLGPLLGIEAARGQGFLGTVLTAARELPRTNPVTLTVGLVCLTLPLAGGTPLDRRLARTSLSAFARSAAVRTVPLLVTAGAIVAVRALALDRRHAVETVGELGDVLPPLTLPPVDPGLWTDLLSSALTIAAVASVTAVAIAMSLASRRGQRIDPNQELVALGAANLGSVFTGAYPVGGSVSRSALTFTAGGVTPVAQLISASTVLVAALSLEPWLGSLPRAALAAIIVAAVVGMIDVRGSLRIWRFSRSEGISLAATFLAVVTLGVEAGIVLGAGSALVLYLSRTSRPRIVTEGYLDEAEQFRSEDREEVEPQRSPVLVLRIDESLYFANTRYCEERVLEMVAGQIPSVRRLVLDLATVAEIDSSALEMLERLVEDLEEAGIEVVFAATRKPVLERLERVGFLDELGEERLFDTTLEAVEMGLEEEEKDDLGPAPYSE